jgi:hypothetical protein
MRCFCIVLLIVLIAHARVSSTAAVGYSDLVSAQPPLAAAHSPSSSTPLYTLVKVGDEFPDAKCLDGSKGDCRALLARAYGKVTSANQERTTSCPPPRPPPPRSGASFSRVIQLSPPYNPVISSLAAHCARLTSHTPSLPQVEAGVTLSPKFKNSFALKFETGASATTTASPAAAHSSAPQMASPSFITAVWL